VFLAYDLSRERHGEIVRELAGKAR
jgi:hypothetical protein